MSSTPVYAARALRAALMAMLALSCMVALRTGAASAEGAAPLPSFTVTYQVRRDSIPIGTVEISYNQPGDGSYAYRSHTRPSDLIALFRDDEIIERSSGTSNGHELVPHEYSYRHIGSKKNRDVQLRFDWQRNQATTTAKGRTWKMDIPDGTLDKFAQQLALMQELGRGKTEQAFTVADGGRLKSYAYSLDGQERVKTPVGEFDTLRMLRSKQGKPPNLTLWCAPALRYLPVRADRTRKGAHYEMELAEIRGLGAFPRPAK